MEVRVTYKLGRQSNERKRDSYTSKERKNRKTH